MPDGVHKKFENLEKRTELIGILEEISDHAAQKEFWIDHIDYPNASGIDHVFHLLFDDTNLGSDSNSEIGYILSNENEAKNIQNLCDKLSEIHSRLGDCESISYINDREWGDVMKLSKVALDSMVQVT